MPFRLPPRLGLAVLVVLGLGLVGGGAAIAERTGMLPFGAAAAGIQEAQEQQQESEEPAPPASSVETTSTGDSPPAVQATVDGREGSGGWYTGDVTVTFTITDDETPEVATEGCEDGVVTEDTIGRAFTCTATSEGGSTTTTVTIARDATAPTGVIATADPAATNGWHTAPFTATWSGTDETSGIASCTQTPYSGPDVRDATLTGSCTDRAGNESEPISYAYSYDATAPVVTARPSRVPDHNGWYNHGLSVSWTSDDPAATCDPDTFYDGGDGERITLEGGCTDEAGNRATATFSFDYDATAPVVTIDSPTADTYVLNQPVTVGITCSDGTSGVDACDSTPADGAAADTSSVGPKTVTAEVADRAGNRSAVSHDYSVVYSPVGVLCGGVAGHQILEPIRADGSTSAQRNSTVPAKFRVCDYNGTPVTAAGVVSSFRIVATNGDAADAPVPSTSAHTEFRSGNSQWIYNISTKSFSKGARYAFRIGLNDGTSIDFSFLVR